MDDPKQTTLGNDSIAEELAQNQQEISIAEFFEKNKHMLGFDSNSRAIVTAVKEAVDNALDATEEANILPDISVEIEKSGRYYRVMIEDNGPGITEEQVPKIFGKLLYGSRFNSRTQNRGQQGIGISAAVLYSQKTSGKPAVVRTVTENSADPIEMEIMIDTETNEPEINNKHSIDWDKDHGTRIELEMEANMRGRKQLHRYIEDTAVVNPHAKISLTEPKWDFSNERVTDELPQETEEIKPHPHGIELGTLQDMLKLTDEDSLGEFLQNDFTRVGKKTCSKILNSYGDHYYGREFEWDGETLFEEREVPVPEQLQEETEEVEETEEDAETDEEETEESEETPEEQLVNRIDSAIYGKSSESISEFTDQIITYLKDNEITYSEIESVIEDSADDVESEYDVRFGSTVREKATTQVWKFISEYRFAQLYDLVDSATSKRKSKAAIYLLAETLDERLKSSAGGIIREQLRDIVEEVADDVSDEVSDSIGNTARTNITDALWSRSQVSSKDVPSLKETLAERDATEALLNGMKETKVRAPPKKCLSPITEERIKDGLKSRFDADFYTASQRDGAVYKGSPFIVEAGIAYGGELDGADEQIQLRRFANRVPLVYQQGACAITQVTEDIGWRNYNLKQSGGGGTLPRGPMVLTVHIASINVPFTSESKDAVSSAEIIEEEIERAIRESARDLKSYLNEQASLKQRQEKRNQMGEIIPPMTESLANVVGVDAPDSSKSIARIMKNLYITKDDSQLRVENYLGKGASLTITDGSGDTEVTLSLGDAESEAVSVKSFDELTIGGIEKQKLTVSREIQNSVAVEPNTN